MRYNLKSFLEHSHCLLAAFTVSGARKKRKKKKEVGLLCFCLHISDFTFSLTSESFFFHSGKDGCKSSAQDPIFNFSTQFKNETVVLEASDGDGRV